MLLLNLFLFCGLFAGIAYGIEFILPPFGKIYYVDIMEILQSLSMTLCNKTNIPAKACFYVTVIIISIIPFIITFCLNRALMRRKKKPSKYRIK